MIHGLNNIFLYSAKRILITMKNNSSNSEVQFCGTVFFE